MSTMRAKFRVTKVQSVGETTEPTQSEGITMVAVSDKPFDSDGNSEDNSFARWTPSGELKITIQNPLLFGKIKEGEKYYIDFTKADQSGEVAKLQRAYDDAEEALREIHMLCGNPDPADGEGTTPHEVKDSVESIIQERNQLLSTFRHTHVNNGDDDACKQCGLDLRHEIHTRINER